MQNAQQKWLELPIVYCVAALLCLCALAPGASCALPGKPRIRLPNLSTVALEQQELTPGAHTFTLQTKIAKDHHLNHEAPSKFVATINAGREDVSYTEGTITSEATPISFTIPALPIGSLTKIVVDSVFYFCPDKDKNTCYMKSYSFTVPVMVTEGDSPTDEQILLEAPLSPNA